MDTKNEVLTIGYGGKKPQLFFQELENLNPDMVIDVRANPYKAYLNVYTKTHLENRLQESYIWIRELGNPSRSLPPHLEDEPIGIEKVHDIMRDHHRIVLLCAEKDENQCHRSYIKQRLLENGV